MDKTARCFNLLLLVLYSMTCAMVKAQCDGKIKVFNDGSGVIQSPNFGKEYGKSANCTWEFTSSSEDKTYLLKLTVTKLKTYFVIGGKKTCSGSYKLTVNNKQAECARYVNSEESSYCYAYYSSSACTSLVSTQNYEYSQLTSFPIPVTYFSDGRTTSPSADDRYTSFVWGFKMNYLYTQCPQETTTPDRPMPATFAEIQEGSVMTGRQITELDHTTNSEPILDASSAIQETTGTTKKQGMRMTFVIPVAAGGGVLLLIIILVVTIVCIRKRNLNKDPMNETLKNSEQEHQQNQEVAASQQVPQSADAKHDKDPYPSSEVKKANDGGQLILNIQQDDSVVYYTTMASTTAVSLPSSNHGKAESDGTTARNSEVGGITSVNQPEGEMYATVDKPSSHIRALLKGHLGPGNVDETSFNAETQYSDVDGATSVTQDDHEMYTTVNKPRNPKHIQQIPKDQLGTSHDEEALYSAVSKNKGRKETVRYQKTMIDNVLYGTT